MPDRPARTSAYALLSTFLANGIDRVFLVPGESYLGILDALADLPEIDPVTCRHEAGAGYMACVDARLTGRPGVALVSRGPGAAHAAIAVHTAQQDAVPLILVVGQVPTRNLRRGAFQEIDYQAMFGSIAKRVTEVTDPAALATAGFEAIRVATSGTPGPVVLVVPEDVQDALVDTPSETWTVGPILSGVPPEAALARVRDLLGRAERPLLVAGGALDVPGGRPALLGFAEAHGVPVAVSFRRQDLFPNRHPLYAGDMGLANPAAQMAAFASCDLLLAVGTRLGDLTTQGYTFPALPRPTQTLVHCHPDARVIGRHFVADVGLACDPTAFLSALSGTPAPPPSPRAAWATLVRGIRESIAAWPDAGGRDGGDGQGVAFGEVVRTLADHAPDDVALCLDAGTFGAPVYRHFPFAWPSRLLAPISGAMGYGVPAAVACQLREPDRCVVCLVGDGGFGMTGAESLLAVERELPILFVVSNNHAYGSIRLHQERRTPGRTVGTGFAHNPDFTALARSFGMGAERVTSREQIAPALARGLAAEQPWLIEVVTRLHTPTRTLPS